MKPDKKILSVNGTDYAIVKGKRWYIEYYTAVSDEVNQRVRSYGQVNRIKDLKIREQKMVELIYQIANKAPELSKSALLNKLEEIRYTYRNKSYFSYKSIVNYYVTWLGTIPDISATQQDAQRFFSHLKSKNLADTRLLAYKRSLSALYNLVNKDNNPFKGLPSLKAGYKSLHYFNDVQIHLIKDYVQDHDRQLWMAIQLLFYCYIRPGEMRLLKIENINFDNHTIEIPGTISKNKKTQKVAIPNQLYVQLLAYRDYPYNYYLFTKAGEPGEIPVTRDHISKRHKEVLTHLKIKGRYAFYSWKHTGVVKAVKAGINIKDLQMQLRHHSLDMVNEYLKNLGVIDSEDLQHHFPTL